MLRSTREVTFRRAKEKDAVTARGPRTVSATRPVDGRRLARKLKDREPRLAHGVFPRLDRLVVFVIVSTLTPLTHVL